MEWHERAEVQRLRREWYAKLADEGFVDIEKVVDARGTVGIYLNGVSPGDLRRRLFKEETEDYYRYARQHAHTLRPGVERAVWELHAEGYGVEKTVEALRRTHGVTPGRAKAIVRAQREAMMAALAAEADENAKRRAAEWDEDDV